MSDQDKVYGLDLTPLPKDWQPIDAITMVKCLAPKGALAYQYCMRTTDKLHLVEGIGMLEAALADLKADYVKLVNRATEDD